MLKHTPEMLAAKHAAHPLMKQMATISRNRTNENRPFTEGEKTQMRSLLSQQQRTYGLRKGATA